MFIISWLIITFLNYFWYFKNKCLITDQQKTRLKGLQIAAELNRTLIDNFIGARANLFDLLKVSNPKKHGDILIKAREQNRNATEEEITKLAEDITRTQKRFLVQNTASLVVDTYIAIGDELMFIKEIDNNHITVKRGEDGTTIDTHINGDVIDAVNAADDALVEVGDDFGFSEQRFDLPDFRTYSPTKGVDVWVSLMK